MLATDKFREPLATPLMASGPDDPNIDPPAEGDVAVEERTEQKVERPRRFKVLMHNDDYTPMEFVVELLRQVFNKPLPHAVEIMYTIHHFGVGMCGIYPAQIAETKIALVHDRARAEGHPLRCSMEPE